MGYRAHVGRFGVHQHDVTSRKSRGGYGFKKSRLSTGLNVIKTMNKGRVKIIEDNLELIQNELGITIKWGTISVVLVETFGRSGSGGDGLGMDTIVLGKTPAGNTIKFWYDQPSSAESAHKHVVYGDKCFVLTTGGINEIEGLTVQ